MSLAQEGFFMGTRIPAALIDLEELARRPGIQSLRGTRLRLDARRTVTAYFAELQRQLESLDLGQFGAMFLPEPGPWTDAVLDFVRQQVDRVVAPMVEGLAERLMEGLVPHLEAAFLFGLEFAEEESTRVEEQAQGPAGQAAVRYAETRTTLLIRSINDTTRQRLQEIIAQGVREGLGPSALGRRLRDEVLSMSRHRAELIANTEMNDAMSQATLDRMQERGARGKTTVLSHNPCPICLANHRQGAISVSQVFQSGHNRTPFHPACQCSLVAARLPGGR